MTPSSGTTPSRSARSTATSTPAAIYSTRPTCTAADKGCTPSQLALGWVLAQGDDVVPIPGTKRVKYLDDNLSAVNVGLTAKPPDTARLQTAP